MKNTLIIFLALISFASCSKSSNGNPQNCNYDTCSVKAPQSEIQQVQMYLASQNITNAYQHCSGVFYIIENVGTGASPGVCSEIIVRYKGTLTNGTQFDANSVGYREYLGNLIGGWIATLPAIKKGGRMIMYVPPSLGYGSQARGPIPANSILIFEIDLVDVF